VAKCRHHRFVTRRTSSSFAAPSQNTQLLCFQSPAAFCAPSRKFGTPRALTGAWRRTGQQVLRITLEENPDAVVLKVEGRLAGPWVEELGRLWKEKAPAVARKKLSLDLRGTTFADAGGIGILKTIYSETGAAILSGTPWTQYLAEEVTNTNP
jgi:hypothetical protein